jgi:hypothetical protein
MNERYNNEPAKEPSNEYGRSEYLYRYIIIAAFFLVICVIYTASAFRIQSLYGSKEEVNTDDYKTRKVAVYAMRGEI